MKKIVFLFVLLILAAAVLAQTDTTKSGTITVKKKSKKKTLVDQANNRIVLIDEYGKVVDTSRVVSFEMAVSLKGELRTVAASGNKLTAEMTHMITDATHGTVIYFTNIKAKNKSGTMENYPSTVIKADSTFRRKSTAFRTIGPQ